jgi:hypothetical protein
LLRDVADVFADGRPTEPSSGVKTHHAQIGELTIENDSLDRAISMAGWLRTALAYTAVVDATPPTFSEKL